MSSITIVCQICTGEYQAPAHLTSYTGICPACYSRESLREWDRLESAKTRAKGTPNTLELAEWLAIVASVRGMCALCGQVPFSHISLLDKSAGVTAENVYPTCRACSWHVEHNFNAALERVRQGLQSGIEEVHARIIRKTG